MIIYINRFGNILLSRPSGKEALAAYLPNFNNISNASVNASVEMLEETKLKI